MNHTPSSVAATAILAGLAVLGFACGENIAPPPADLTPFLPQNLSAASLDVRTVGLAWNLPSNVNDTVLVGYVVEAAGQQTSIGKRESVFVASSLPPGVSQFRVSPLGAGGATAPGPTISWAPAERFDTAFVLYEYNVSALSRPVGLKMGSRLTDPEALPLALAAQNSMDLWVNGDAGLPLTLRSANLWLADWRVTQFSSVTTPAPSLDVAIPAYPAPSTFGQGIVQIQNNTIYYAICEGDNPNELNYVRIHVRVLPGSFPDRSIEIRLSLQRQPGVPFAEGSEGRSARVPAGSSASLDHT